MPSQAHDPSSYVEQILERRRPEAHVVLADQDRSLTTEQLRREVYAVARELAALGVGPGTVVGLVTGNVCGALSVRYAAHLLGCAAVHVPDAGDPVRTARFLRETETSVVLVTADKAAALAAALRSPSAATRPRLLSIGPVDEDVLPVEVDVIAGSAARDGSPMRGSARPDDLASLVASGGTTGAPRASLRSFADWASLVRGPENPRRRQLVCTPLAHVAQVLTDQTLLGGGTVVLRAATAPFAAGEVLATIEAERITHLCLVEPALVELLDHDDLRRRDLSSLVGITHVGADACGSLRARLCERTRSVGLDDVLVHTYGSSEIGMVSVLAGTDYSGSRPRLLATAGRPLPGVEVTIEGPDGTAAPVGVAGEIVVRSAAVCLSTTRHRDPLTDPAREAVDDHSDRRRRRTGDCGALDRAGWLTVRGRMADAVPGPDGPVFPVDVQEALCAHPGVRYAVAVPSPSGAGFSALAVIGPDDRVTADELLRLVRRRYSVDTVVLCDSVPVTEQGKPARDAVRVLTSAGPLALGRAS